MVLRIQVLDQALSVDGQEFPKLTLNREVFNVFEGLQTCFGDAFGQLAGLFVAFRSAAMISPAPSIA